MKLKYTVDPSADEPIVLVNKHIGINDEEGEGIMGDQFQNELMYLDTLGKKTIQVHICSPGGSVLEGMKMYHAMLATKTKVDTYNGGMAASISGALFQAGRKRFMYDHALQMMHNPFDPDSNNYTPELQAFKDSIVKMLGRKTQKTNEEISDYMNNTTWMNAEQCLATGFCDEIIPISQLNKPRAKSLTTVDVKADYNNYLQFFNSINTKKEPSMKKVTNFLKINDSATEDSILSAVESIQNRAEAAETEKTKIAGELEKAQSDLATSQNKVTELQNSLTALKEKEDAEKATALDNAATLLAENAAKVGKIKNDAETISKIKAQAIANFDGTKTLLDSIAINKKSPEIINGGGAAETTASKYTMGAQMINIANQTKLK